MKYTNEIIINRPIDKVIELFDDPKNLPKWMEGLQSFEHLSGKAGYPGAKSKLKFKMGNREMEMIETVLVRDLPNEFSGTYEMGGTLNIIKNKFVQISNDKTKYIADNEFQFKGFMKFLAFFMGGVFRKQSFKYMVAFKDFAEKQM